MDAEAVKAYMEAVIRETPISQDVLITDLEQYAGCISHATVAYNSLAPAAPPPAPASPPLAPVAETAEELRRRARNLRKKLFLTAGLQSRVDAGLVHPCAQQLGKLACRGELEEELAAVTEALAVLPDSATATTSSDDEATVPDHAAPVPADSIPRRLVAAAQGHWDHDRIRAQREAYAARREAEAPEASTAWSDEAEAVLLSEVEGQRARDGGVHWGHVANVVHHVTGYALTGPEARERYESERRDGVQRLLRLDDERERAAAARARDQERREREANVGGSWVCTACTFENPNPNALVCDLCNTVRPVAA